MIPRQTKARQRKAGIFPGFSLTRMQRAEYSDEMLAAVGWRIPLGRHADPAEIRALVADDVIGAERRNRNHLVRAFHLIY